VIGPSADDDGGSADDDGGLTASIEDESFVVFGGEVHDLPELGPGDVGVMRMVKSMR
jgi:hypothetical protein